MANKRIIDLTEIQNIAEDDYVILDSNTDGTRKILASNIGEGSGGVNYSTTEQDTGLKWIDGKPIYQKTLNPNITLTTTGQSVMTMADIDTIVDTKPLLVKGGNQCQSPYSPSDAFVTWQLISEDLLFYITGSHYDDAVLKYVTVQYTKTTDTV